MENEELFIPKTKHKFLKILLATLIIAGIGVGGYFLYQDKFNNPKNIVNNILEKEISKKSELFVTEDGVYKINGFIKAIVNLGKENEKVTDVLNDVDFQFSGEIDTKESISNIEINTKYKNEKLIDFNTYVENNNYYILLNDIFDKYIKIENKDNSDELKDIVKNIKLNSKDIDTLIDALKQAFKEEINKYDFKKESDSISIDGNTVNVYNNYIILKNDEVNKFASAIINNIANNSEVTSIIGKLSDNDGKVVLVAIASELEKVPFTGTYRINFYTDKGIFNKNLISIRQEITQNNIPITINMDKIEDGIIMSFAEMGMSITIKAKKNSSNYNIGFTVTAMDNYININASINYEKIKELTKPDVSNNKKFEELSEEEKKQIQDGFEKNDALKNIFTKLQDKVPELKA